MPRRENRKSHSRIRVTDSSSPMFDELDFRSTCVSKAAYDTFWQAKYTIDDTEARFGTRLRSYVCPYCGKYHLTERK